MSSAKRRSFDYGSSMLQWSHVYANNPLDRQIMERKMQQCVGEVILLLW